MTILIILLCLITAASVTFIVVDKFILKKNNDSLNSTAVENNLINTPNNSENSTSNEISNEVSKEHEVTNNSSEKSTTEITNEVSNSVINNTSEKNITETSKTNENKITYAETDLDILKYIGYWTDEYELDDLTINSIEGNEINFNFGLFRITTFENIKAYFNADERIAEFNTNSTEMGEFWQGIYGTLKFENNKIIMEITKSECEYVSPVVLVFDTHK